LFNFLMQKANSHLPAFAVACLLLPARVALPLRAVVAGISPLGDLLDRHHQVKAVL
jgi:hypothetical protein